MSDVKWIKITTDIFDDEKILLIEAMPDSYAIITVWFKMLCLAGKQNNSGVFILNDKIAYTDKMLATIFRMKETTVQFALKTFEELGMVEIVDGVITIPNWSKHQNLDSLDNKKEYMRKYMAKKRSEQRELACKTNSKTNSKTNCKTNVSSLDIDIERDIERDIDIDTIGNTLETPCIQDGNNLETEHNITKHNITKQNSIAESPKRFKKPSVDEVQEYINEAKLNVSATRFVDYYESNGWKVGRNPMKDWKACCRSWNKNNYSQRPNFTSSEMKTEEVDLNELRKKVFE